MLLQGHDPFSSTQNVMGLMQGEKGKAAHRPRGWRRQKNLSGPPLLSETVVCTL